MGKQRPAGEAGKFRGKQGHTGWRRNYEIKDGRLVARQYGNPDQLLIAFEPFCMQQFQQGGSKI